MLISGTTGSNWKIIFELHSTFIDECYRLHNIMLRPIGARGGTQTGILRFTKEMFIYKWLLMVIVEITNRNSIYILLVVIG